MEFAGDPRYAGGMRLDDIAKAVGCELRGDPAIEISRLWPIDTAGPGDLSFVANPRYARFLRTTRASAVIVASDTAEVAMATLRSPAPYAAFAAALDLFYSPPPRRRGIHPSAVIAASARIGDDAAIGPQVVIEDDVQIGAGATLGPGVTIGHGSVIGDGFVAHARVTVREWVRIGDRVILHAGAVIGADGFGYVPVAGGLRKLPQAGTVVIGDDVEIGANTAIDRATIGETRIGNGVKIDNLVQIGHGCDIGDNSVLAAQTGLAGSTRLGQWVQMGGQSASGGHLAIGDGSRIAGRGAVAADVEAGATVAGLPAIPVEQWRRSVAVFPRLWDILRRLRRLEKAVQGGDQSVP